MISHQPFLFSFQFFPAETHCYFQPFFLILPRPSFLVFGSVQPNETVMHAALHVLLYLEKQTPDVPSCTA